MIIYDESYLQKESGHFLKSSISLKILSKISKFAFFFNGSSCMVTNIGKKNSQIFGKTVRGEKCQKIIGSFLKEK